MQEARVVVRFQNQNVASGEGVPELGSGPTQIGCYPQLEARFGIGYGDGHRIPSIVGGEEGLHPEGSHRKGEAGSVRPEFLSASEEGAASLPSGVREEDGGSVSTGEDPNPTGVISVVVGDDDSLNFLCENTQSS